MYRAGQPAAPRWLAGRVHNLQSCIKATMYIDCYQYLKTHPVMHASLHTWNFPTGGPTQNSAFYNYQMGLLKENVTTACDTSPTSSA